MMPYRDLLLSAHLSKNNLPPANGNSKCSITKTLKNCDLVVRGEKSAGVKYWITLGCRAKCRIISTASRSLSAMMHSRLNGRVPHRNDARTALGGGVERGRHE